MYLMLAKGLKIIKNESKTKLLSYNKVLSNYLNVLIQLKYVYMIVKPFPSNNSLFDRNDSLTCVEKSPALGNTPFSLANRTSHVNYFQYLSLPPLSDFHM